MVDLAKLLNDIDDDIELTEILGESPEFNLRCKVAIRELAAERDALKAELEAARKQEPAIYRLRYTEATSGWVDVTKDVYDRHKDNQNYDAKVFYASPVPAQQSAEVNQEYPMQPMFLDKGLPRFEKNPIIDRLCEKHGLNEIGIWWQVNNIERKYIEQLYQLIGYSIRGYDELSEVSDASFERANAMAEQLLKGGER